MSTTSIYCWERDDYIEDFSGPTYTSHKRNARLHGSPHGVFSVFSGFRLVTISSCESLTLVQVDVP